MRQTYMHNVEEHFKYLKENKQVDYKTKGSFRNTLSNEIEKKLIKIENEDEETWDKLNLVSMDPMYLADVILRVEFILISLRTISKKENIVLTLADARAFFSSPLLPHHEKYSKESLLIESNMRVYFNKSWSHESIIVRDLTHYFLIKNILSEGELWFSLLPGCVIDADIMKKELFTDSSPISVNNNISNLKTTRVQIYKRMLLNNINHKEIDSKPPLSKIDYWFNEKDNYQKVNVKFAATDRNKKETYEIRHVYNASIKEKYKEFLMSLNLEQARLSKKKKNNLNIEIDLEELREFAFSIIDARDPLPNWGDRISKINFFDVASELNIKKIKINDINHWIGLPNVGKTTLMTILAAFLKEKYSLKTAIILRENNDVDSIASSLQKCGYKAVPFIGLSNQRGHFKRRLNSLKQVEDIREDNVLPFYSSSCKMKSILDLSIDDDVEKADFCYTINYKEEERRGESVREKQDDYIGNLTCPFILECPKYSTRQKFKENDIFLTNIQSFVQSLTKNGLFAERVPSLELLAKECDVIFVDEADNMLQSIDSLFKDEEFIVEGIERGNLELLLDEINKESRGKKADNHEVATWLSTARNCITIAESILLMITDGFVPKTILKNPFTSRSIFKYLCFRLAKAIDGGFEEQNLMDDRLFYDVEINSAKLNESRIDMQNYFSKYIDEFTLGYSRGSSTTSQDDLIVKMIKTAHTVYSTKDGDFPTESNLCFDLLMEKFDINANHILGNRIDGYKRLFRFAIAVSAFEVLYNYTQVHVDCCREFIKDESLANENRYATQFYKHYTGILPIAAGGGQYGLSYEVDGKRKSLKIKKYLNVGRYLLYNMPKIFKGLDLTDTSRIVLMSATSYMPYSPNYHINIEPEYILENSDATNLKIKYMKAFLYDENGNILKLSGCDPSAQDNVLKKMANDLCIYDRSNKSSIPKIKKILATTKKGREKVAFTLGSFDEAMQFGQYLKASLNEYNLSGEIKFCIVDSKENRKGSEGLDIFLKSNLNDFSSTDYNVAIIVTKSLERGVNILTKGKEDEDSDEEIYFAAFSTLVYLKRPYLIPNDINDLIAILNSYSMDMYKKNLSEASSELGENYSIEKYISLIHQNSKKLEYEFYSRTYYRFIKDEAVRLAILSNILVSTHQLEGRFYRGNVEATVIYADGSFFPEEAKGDRNKESYKTSIIEGFRYYFRYLNKNETEKDIKIYKIIRKLYGFRIDALDDIDYMI